MFNFRHYVILLKTFKFSLIVTIMTMNALKIELEALNGLVLALDNHCVSHIYERGDVSCDKSGDFWSMGVLEMYREG